MTKAAIHIHVEYSRVGGVHLMCSPDLPGLLIADIDFDRALRDVLPAIEALEEEREKRALRAVWCGRKPVPTLPNGEISQVFKVVLQ